MQSSFAVLGYKGKHFELLTQAIEKQGKRVLHVNIRLHFLIGEFHYVSSQVTMLSKVELFSTAALTTQQSNIFFFSPLNYLFSWLRSLPLSFFSIISLFPPFAFLCLFIDNLRYPQPNHRSCEDTVGPRCHPSNQTNHISSQLHKPLPSDTFFFSPRLLDLNGAVPQLSSLLWKALGGNSDSLQLCFLITTRRMV